MEILLTEASGFVNKKMSGHINNNLTSNFSFDIFYAIPFPKKRR